MAGEAAGRGWTRTLALLGAAAMMGVLFPALSGARENRAAARSKPAARDAEPAEAYRSAILVEATSGNVLFEKDAHRQAPPASMTKMMLMLLVAERVKNGEMRWDDPITASRHASKMGGSQVFLKEGEVFPLAEMMQAIIIHSANDASMAVAEAIAGSAESFVDLMNERAQELGLKETVYRSPHGLPPARGQEPDLTSPYDLAMLARELVKFPEIMQWARTAEAPFRGGSFIMRNTNHLVRSGGWIDGLKTGFYQEAGFCITATGQREGLRLISVVMGSPRKQQSFDEAAKLLNRGFSQFKVNLAVKRGDVVATDVLVKGGKPRFIRVLAGDDVRVLSPKSEKAAFTFEVAIPGELAPPLAASATIGQVIVKQDGREIGRVPALASEAVEKEPSLLERLF